MESPEIATLCLLTYLSIILYYYLVEKKILWKFVASYQTQIKLAM